MTIATCIIFCDDILGSLSSQILNILFLEKTTSVYHSQEMDHHTSLDHKVDHKTKTIWTNNKVDYHHHNNNHNNYHHYHYYYYHHYYNYMDHNHMDYNYMETIYMDNYMETNYVDNYMDNYMDNNMDYYYMETTS